jgi:hypothetical protein
MIEESLGGHSIIGLLSMARFGFGIVAEAFFIVYILVTILGGEVNFSGEGVS